MSNRSLRSISTHTTSHLLTQLLWRNKFGNLNAYILLTLVVQLQLSYPRSSNRQAVINMYQAVQPYYRDVKPPPNPRHSIARFQIIPHHPHMYPTTLRDRPITPHTF